MNKPKKGGSKRPNRSIPHPADNFSVPITPGTTVTISNTGPLPPPPPVQISAFQSFISPLIGSLILGVAYYVLYLNRYGEGFLADISEFAWVFLSIFLLVLCIAVANGIKLVYFLSKKITGKPIIYFPITVFVLVLIVFAFFVGKDFIFRGSFFNSVMAGVHDTLGYIGIYVPSTDGGKWNGVYSLDFALGRCTGSVATEVDINALIKQFASGRSGGFEIYNSRITIYKGGFVDANGKAISTFNKTGVNLVLEYQFKDTGGVLTYTGTYRMWDINPYIEFDCNGGISGTKK